ncbi:MAG: zinc-ribbon domain-containing protein, partial [Solirubrobacteraceae bacterium]
MALACRHTPRARRPADPTRNGELDPFAVWPYSSRKLCWRCSRCGQEWRDNPRTAPTGAAARLAHARLSWRPPERYPASDRSPPSTPRWGRSFTRRATAALTPTRSARARRRSCGGCCRRQ